MQHPYLFNITNKLYCTAWKGDPIEFQPAKHWFAPSKAPTITLSLFNVIKQDIFYFLIMYSNWCLNCQALICPLLITKSNQIPVQYHKTSCIVMLGNYINLFLNCQALIWSWLITNSTPDSVLDSYEEQESWID